MHTQDLSGDGWTVRAVGDLAHVPEHIRGRVFPARVPGCVHLDLIRAGVLRHPNLGYAERDQEWVGRTDWRYERRFEVRPHQVAGGDTRVRFDRLDTLARVSINGQGLGNATNFHHRHSFPVEDALEPGVNELAVTITAPLTFAEREHARSGRLPHNGDELGWHPFNMLRKPACNFGWDWGPRVTTSGIEGGARLLADAEPWWCGQPPVLRREAESHWVIEFAAVPAPASAGDEASHFSLSLGDSPIPIDCARTRDGETVRLHIRVKDPELWWPRGYGNQPVYTLRLQLEGAAGERHQSWRIGFRALELDTASDEIGSAFVLRVNDEPVFCRGANWIPDTLFPGEATPERIRERVRQAAAANMNMLRVWGGGLCEQEAFYEACDELGIMVWQDFMFACAIYPELDLLAPVSTEVLNLVRRLACHPSVVLWCGGNECTEGYQHWGWRERMPAGKRWGEALWAQLIPRVLQLAQPGALYWPNSPWSGAVEDVRDPNHGDRHTWDLHFEDVRKMVPRFVSEFGRVAPACERTLWEAEVFGSAAPASWPREAPPLNDEVRAALEHRLRQTGGSKVAYDPVLPDHFRRVATDLRGWLWQTQVLQARALAIHIEWLRANSPRCMGALVWQLNDCWACQSWSLIDYGGRPKPAWYAVRRSFQPRPLTIQPLEQGRGLSRPRTEPLSAVLVNDTGEAFEGECRVSRVGFSGIELASAAARLAVDARSVGRLDRLHDLVGEPEDRSSEALVVECAGERSVWFWGRDRELHLPEEPLSAAFVERDGRVLLRLEARALARDVIIAADLLGEQARAAENCFTMLAGETREVEIEMAEPGLTRTIEISEVVRSASGVV